MHVQVANPWMLYLLWLVPLLTVCWVWLDNRHARALDRLAAPHLRSRLAPPDLRTRQSWQLALVSLGVLLLLLAGARPQWGEREELVLSRGRDVVIAVDVSRSMLAPDVHPNRLGRAKADLIDLIRELDGDRAAVLAFRKSPVMVCPFTTDYAFLKQAVDALAPHSAPRGETDIGAAITRALELFGEDSLAHRALILVSDGEDLSGRALEAATQAGSLGIPIYTVGIGSRGGSRIPDADSQSGYLRDGDQDAVSKLDDSTLHAIAEASAGGAYIPLGTAGTASTTLGQLYRRRLAMIEARELAESGRRRRVERFQWFLAPAILCLLAAAALSRGRLAVRRRAMPQQALLLLLLLSASAAPLRAEVEATATATGSTSRAASTTPAAVPTPPTPTGHTAAWEAQKRARLGNHAQAASLYETAAQGVSPALARQFLQNAAAEHYAAGNLDRAEMLLTQLSATATATAGSSQAAAADTLRALGGVLHDMAERTSVTNAATAQTRTQILERAGNAFRDAAKRGSGIQARQDLAAVLDRWSHARTEAETRELDERYGQMALPQLMDQLFRQQRDIRLQAHAQATNQTPERVTQLESLADAQRDLAKAWTPLQTKLADALSQPGGSNATNAQQAAAMAAFVEQTRNMAHTTADMLRDLDPEATAASRQSEEATYQLWKPTAPFESLITEGLHRQTQASDATSKAAADHPIDFPQLLYDQKEAAELTRLFRERFEAAIPESGNLQVVTNMVKDTPVVSTNGISAETRAEILGLSDLLEEAQTSCATALGNREFQNASRQQQECLDAANRIVELLPTPPPQDQQQQDEPQEQDPQQQDEPPDDNQEPQPSENPQDQQPQPSENEPQQQEEEPQTSDENRETRDAETLLERALEREREYEELKRERDRFIPMLPGQRDL